MDSRIQQHTAFVSPALEVLGSAVARQVVGRVQTEIWMLLANDERDRQPRPIKLSVRLQQVDAAARLTLGRNRDCDESGGMSFIISLTEVTGGASSSGQEVLKQMYSFAQRKPRRKSQEVALLASAWLSLAFVGKISASSYICPLWDSKIL